MNSKLQFRVLYRHFLFRLMDVELLSASAGGDSNVLLGRLGSLLIFGSLLSSYVALAVGAAARESGLPAALWGAERFAFSLTMLVVGVFALLSWDSTFPDRRDVLVLAPLPVRARTLFAAKMAAAGAALGLRLRQWNTLPGCAGPGGVASLPVAVLIGGGAFALSYLRTLRKIVEESDIAPGRRGGIWLPRFGSLPQTAVAQFVIRTLLRSRPHRTILAFYLGGGFA